MYVFTFYMLKHFLYQLIRKEHKLLKKTLNAKRLQRVNKKEADSR